MQNLYGLAMVFGPFLLIVGAWLFFNSDKLHKLWSYKAVEGNFHVVGMINVLLGLFIITQYSVWAMNAAVFVTLLGWFLLVRGFLVLFFPKFLFELTMHSKTAFKTWGVILFVWGLIIAKIGYYIAS